MKKKLLAVAGAAALLLVVSGCSASGSGSSGGKQTLTIEDYYTSQPNEGSMVKAYDQCADQIGVKLSRTAVPGANLISKVLQQSSSKTLPDVLMLDNPDVQQIAASGALAPLSDFGVKDTGFFDGVEKAGTYDGKVYGVAPVINTLALFYNTDMLSAAGITPPKTWDELAADAKKLTTSSTYGLAFSGINTYEGSWQFLPFMWSNGGNESNINTPETTQALQFLTDLVNNGSSSKSVVTWAQADVEAQFVAGKAAMMVNGPWNIPDLNNHKNIKWAAVPVPTRLASQTSVAPLGGETFNIPQTGNKDKQKLAGQFINCLTTDKMMTQIAKATYNIPAKASAATAFAKEVPSEAAFATAVATARARTAELGPNWPKAATEIYTAMQLAYTGKMSPADALAQAKPVAKGK
jgi:multiple sugar transport system substrate-binding protein